MEEDEKAKDVVLGLVRERSDEAPRRVARLRAYVDTHRKRNRDTTAAKQCPAATDSKACPSRKKNMDTEGGDKSVPSGSMEPSDRCGCRRRRRRRRRSCSRRRRRRRRRSCGSRRRRRRRSCGRRRRRRRSRSCSRRRRRSCGVRRRRRRACTRLSRSLIRRLLAM